MSQLKNLKNSRLGAAETRRNVAHWKTLCTQIIPFKGGDTGGGRPRRTPLRLASRKPAITRSLINEASNSAAPRTMRWPDGLESSIWSLSETNTIPSASNSRMAVASPLIERNNRSSFQINSKSFTSLTNKLNLLQSYRDRKQFHVSGF